MFAFANHSTERYHHHHHRGGKVVGWLLDLQKMVTSSRMGREDVCVTWCDVEKKGPRRTGNYPIQSLDGISIHSTHLQPPPTTFSLLSLALSFSITITLLLLPPENVHAFRPEERAEIIIEMLHNLGNKPARRTRGG